MKKWMLAAGVLSLALTACGDDQASESVAEPQTEEVETAQEEPTADVYFTDGEAKLNDLKIKITETKVIPVGEPGNEYGEKPVFAIWYDTTNLTDKDIDPSTAWMVVFTAIQDNNPNAINELEVGPSPDEAYLDSQLETIKKGGTVSNAVAYILDDRETPVTLVANQGIGGQELGQQEFPVQ